ncbi:MAG TPA: outer membrane protein assembly factor BamD [Bacteroidetes bacterium]|nr:outer membrane protein assembly factor BamD [Bacteroidota bacterium]HEX04061.1 outer membrane protein assembly factor BamD [Bacteroidota bacterium]
MVLAMTICRWMPHGRRSTITMSGGDTWMRPSTWKSSSSTTLDRPSDSAQYLLAESHFEMDEYIISASEYEKLISQYPRSPLVEEGEYKLGLSFYELSPKYQKEQVYTDKAVEMFQLFIEDFPNSMLVSEAEERILELRTKLAKKEFQAGRLYHRMGEYKAARLYYQSVLDNYYDSEFAEESQLLKADSWSDEKEWAEAQAAYQGYLIRYPDSDRVDYINRQIEYVKKRHQEQLAKEAEGERGGVFRLFDPKDE